MRIEQIDSNVHVVTGTNVNWALVAEGDEVTVVDAGYPNDSRALLASIEAIGRRPEDVRAIVLTHAHLDHMGGIPALLKRTDAPVLTGAVEDAHARREHLEQISPLQMLAQARSKSGAIWVAQTLRAVLPHITMKVPSAQAVDFDTELDIPGRLRAISTPGHTSGHTAFLMESTGTLFSGDALVTGHRLLPGSPRSQLLSSVFSEDEAEMRESLKTLGGLPADCLVPGHGPVERRPLNRITAEVLAQLG